MEIQLFCGVNAKTNIFTCLMKRQSELRNLHENYDAEFQFFDSTASYELPENFSACLINFSITP